MNTSSQQISELRDTLSNRLAALLDLHLTVKHIHWNVVGPNFISVHEMLDDFDAKVRPMADTTAERIRTLGGDPLGTPGAITSIRTWDDYDLARGRSEAHLAKLDAVFDGVIDDHRKAIATAGDVDPVTEDMLITQTADLELMQWFVRSFLENVGGDAARPGTAA